MQFFAILAATLPVVLATGNNPNKCNADNCARAVTGTRPGKVPDIASRSADCSSFQTVVVTPAAVTVTVIEPIGGGGGGGAPAPALERRVEPGPITSTPTSIPTYASPCAGTTAYASACSCFGITRGITTLPVPTVTVTEPAGYCKNAGVCPYSSDQLYTCAEGLYSTCVCGTDGDGKASCFPNAFCIDLKKCPGGKNSECDGGACIIGTCCGEPVCSPPSNSCFNANTPSRLFKVRRDIDIEHARRADSCDNVAGIC